MRKHDDFSEWYNTLVEETDLVDKRYPIKGMNVWRPNGWALMSAIDRTIRREFDATGHQEVAFPLLVPQTEFQKEADHIKGFDAEVYWVTRAGVNELDVPLLLRPTSETAMYPVFALWIRSHNDLPLKTYQIVNTFRYETKMTRAFIRVREIHFFEAHTCHADEADAEAQVAEDREIMARLAHDLCLPYLLSRRPEWDKFPGAHYSLGADVLMPNGRTLQIGTIHHYRDNFARPYDIRYEQSDGEWEHVHQTTYGMSERLLGAVVAIHGDDKGLMLPPAIAPQQVVVVPILAKTEQERVTAAATALAARLRQAGLRVHLDDRDVRPGAKFYHWEQRGVPLRVELGARDLAAGVVMLARRDTGAKRTIADDDGLPEALHAELAAMANELRQRAERDLAERTVAVDDLYTEPPAGRVLRFGWCGSTDCADEIEKGWDMKFLGTAADDDERVACLVCGRPDGVVTYASRQM